MSEKFKNKYTIKSARLPGYDYSQDGTYFVTICTKNHEEFFGKIENEKMILSDIGKIAEKFYREIPNHFPFVVLDECVVMPNHVHGIIEIVKTPNVETPNLGVSTTTQHCKPGCLGVIINQYKRICTMEIGKQFPCVGFQWQPRFYNHIIRNEKSLNKIREYIQTNPAMWERDRNNIENLWM